MMVRVWQNSRLFFKNFLVFDTRATNRQFANNTIQ